MDTTPNNGFSILPKMLRSKHDGRCWDMDTSSSNMLVWGECHGGEYTFLLSLGVLLVASFHLTSALCVAAPVSIVPGSNQQFYYDTTTKQIKVYYNNKCLDYNYGNGNLYVGNCHTGSNQQFIVRSDGQVYTPYDGKCIDQNLSTNNLYLFNCHTGNNQKWITELNFWCNKDTANCWNGQTLVRDYTKSCQFDYSSCPPTPRPTPSPTPYPTPLPTPGPTRRPTPLPTPHPTPTPWPTPQPTPYPTPYPTHDFTSSPTQGKSSLLI
jgi:Ricin-type beta-trefoil lectin domain